jgi:hypothetical protein
MTENELGAEGEQRLAHYPTLRKHFLLRMLHSERNVFVLEEK